MDDKQLDRSLQSVGKRCFVQYFAQFSDLTIEGGDLVEFLMKKENWKEAACRTRVTQARKILREGQAKEALEIIAASNKLDDDVIMMAKQRLKNMSE